MRYFLVVGEASADLHASNLIKSLKVLDPQAEFQFVGGDLMAQESQVPPIVHYRDLAFMGFISVIKNLGAIKRSAKKMQEALLSFAPDVVIPIDSSGFNFQYVLPFVKKNLSCPIVYYIAPKLWAWKKWRIKKLKASVDLLLTILPFEESFFKAYGVPCHYVGNPTVESVVPYAQNLKEQELGSKKQIAVLAGSRRQEIKANLDVMLRSLEKFALDYKIVVAAAPSIEEEVYAEFKERYPFIKVVFSQTFSVLSESSLALVTSGTATLETALIGIPQVVCYRMGGLSITRAVWDRFFSVKYISLVNLILDREAIPELMGAEVCVARLEKEVEALLQASTLREKQLCDYHELRGLIGGSSTGMEAGKQIYELIH